MALTPTLKKQLRAEIQNFCVVAEKNQARWHYTEQRPYSGLGKPAGDYHWDDCSAYMALIFWRAGHLIGHGVADPLGEHYSGWGNTETEHAFLQAHPCSPPYYVGDMAIYGTLGDLSTQHTTICRKGGTAAVSIWSSNGSEAAPNTAPLHYRRDLIGVYRHPALL